MIRKKNKGFTLIELLVVVAIIGILASVGVVAYSGYTQSAKKGAAKSNHNSVKKWVQNELQKCSIGESKAMNGALDCTTNSANETAIVTAIVKSLATDSDDMKNPWSSSGADAVTATANTGCTTDAMAGTVYVVDDTNDGIAIHTCTKKFKTGDASKDYEMSDTINNAT